MPTSGNSGCATAKSTSAVDFVTIHILPYWEDLPVAAPKTPPAHVDDIRKRMAVAFPGQGNPDRRNRLAERRADARRRAAVAHQPGARACPKSWTLAKRENFRVNLIEAYDQPWKRQLEGTVGGYWGLIDDAQRAVKYPPGEPISNYPSWKLQMGCGMALSALVFLAGWLTLRRRPWKPRLAAWIAVGTSATTAGMLLGIAADKMLYESYGVGGWLQWGALLAAAIASPLLCANAAMSGRPLPTFLELLGPRDAAPARLLTALLGLVLVVTTLIAARNRARLCVRSALPRFSVRLADHGGGAVRGLDAAQPAERGRAPDRRIRLCRLAGRRPRCSPASTRATRTGSRCGPARSICCWRSRCGGRGPCKSQNEQADRNPRQRDIVEHDPESRRDQPAGQQHDRRPHDVKRRDDQRDDAEHRILEQIGGKRARLAQHGLQAGVAGQRHGRELDREIAQIKRVADGDEADHQQELHLIGREPERGFFHRRNMVGIGGRDKRSAIAGRRVKNSA